MKIKVLSVAEVNNYLKRTVDNDFILNNLAVKGEISNLKYHSSGHIYFSLKDEGGKINCVMFKTSAYNLNFNLEEGMSVIASGRLSVYVQTGAVQLYCNELEKEGLGKLYAQFEKLKVKLSEQGYFNQEFKKDIPQFTERIGVITSETGAAVRDIFNVTRRRNSLVDIVLYPAKVQGIDAFKDVISGIRYFNKSKSVDVIILGRGGGSIEELWNFNEEALALEIFKSKIPIISAVGHESDFTISDFVADFRAATPSQGAEIAVPEEEDIFRKIDDIKIAINNRIKDRIDSERFKIESLEKILKLNSPMNKIVNSYLEVDKIKNTLNVIIKNKIQMEKEKLNGLNNLLISNNPVKLLSKGYAIIEDKDGIVASTKKLKEKKEILITLRDGTAFGEFNPK